MSSPWGNKKEEMKFSVSECDWREGYVQYDSVDDGGIQIKNKIMTEKDSDESLKCCYLSPPDGTTILKLKPSGNNNRNRRQSNNANNKRVLFWNSKSHFHQQLKVPKSWAAGENMALIQFQAKARSSISVAISNKPGFSKDSFREIHLGTGGNTSTTIATSTSKSTSSSTTSQEKKEEEPKLNDNGDEDDEKEEKAMAETTTETETTTTKETRFVSIPSRVCSVENWVSYWILVSNSENESESKLYVGIGDTIGQQSIGLLDSETATTSNSTTYTTTSTSTDEKPSNEDGDNVENGNNNQFYYVGFGNSATRGRQQHPQQQQQVEIQKVVVSSIDRMLLSCLPTSNDDLQVVVVENTGNVSNSNDDIRKLLEEYKKECQIRQARAAKYGTEYKHPEPDAFLPWSQAKRLKDTTFPQHKGFVSGIDVMDPNEISKMEARKARFGQTATGINNGGEEKPREEDATTNDSGSNALPVLQAWDKEDMVRPYRNDPPSSLWKDPSQKQGQDEERQADFSSFAMEPREDATWVNDKLHIFAIDWAAFKQIRNKDLMSYFSVYGPTYIEWLGDLSCNICFQDMHTATRAMMSLSQEIPSPPPEEATNATSNADSTDDINEDSEDKKEQSPTDFGNMNWRFCLKPIRKVANDKYGRQNTIARVLMRRALSTDALEERPNSWPAPPGGFSATKVLGPHSDLRQYRNKKKRQRGGWVSRKSRELEYTGTGEHPLLSQGLASGRGGFSVEELEKERAAKRAKQNESEAS